MDLNAEIQKLNLQPGDVLVVKSQDIDYAIVRALEAKFGCKVLGLGPDDDASTLNITPESTLVLRGPDVEDLSAEARDSARAHLMKTTGCKAVLFLGENVSASVEE